MRSALGLLLFFSTTAQGTFASASALRNIGGRRFPHPFVSMVIDGTHNSLAIFATWRHFHVTLSSPSPSPPSRGPSLSLKGEGNEASPRSGVSGVGEGLRYSTRCTYLPPSLSA